MVQLNWNLLFGVLGKLDSHFLVLVDSLFELVDQLAQRCFVEKLSLEHFKTRSIKPVEVTTPNRQKKHLRLAFQGFENLELLSLAEVFSDALSFLLLARRLARSRGCLRGPWRFALQRVAQRLDRLKHSNSN